MFCEFALLLAVPGVFALIHIRKWNSSGVGLEALPGIASPKVSAMSGKPASMATPDSEITPEELYRGAGTRQSFGHAGPYPRHTSSPVKKL